MLDGLGIVRNWDGAASPVVHQADHFLDELLAIVEASTTSAPSRALSSPLAVGREGAFEFNASVRVYMSKLLTAEKRRVAKGSGSVSGSGAETEKEGPKDVAWQVFNATRCLWGC